MATAFAELFCEVEAGWRPRRHLAPLLTAVLYTRLSEVWVRRGPVARVVRVHTTLTGDHRVEAVAIVRRGPRYGALAFRLRRTGRGWRVDELVRPEDGPLPPPHPRLLDTAGEDHPGPAGIGAGWRAGLASG